MFEAARLDAWVLEIGMGGRLDAVNVVDPDVAVVVSIGFDHQEYLGTTLEAIAREKAGIFRRGRPAVLGSRDMPRVLEEIALEKGAPLKRPGIEYRYALDDGTWQYRGSRWNLQRLPPPALAGDAQYANAAAAIAALEELVARFTIPPAAVARGLSEVKLAARFQVIEPAAPDVRQHGYWMWRTIRPRRVCSRATCAATRAAGGLWRCAEFWPTRMRRAWSRNCATASMPGGACPSRENEAAVPLRSRRRSRMRVAAPVEAAPSIAAACAAASANARPKDRIVVFGSFHVVGPAMDWLEANALLPPVAA